MIGREFNYAADFKALPERGAEKRTEQPVGMVLFLRPGIRKENIHLARMVRRQQVMKRIKRLEPQDGRVDNSAATAFAVEKAHALEHSLNTQKIAIGIRRGAGGKKFTLATADFDLERTLKIEVERLAGIGYTNYQPFAFSKSFMKETSASTPSIGNAL